MSIASIKALTVVLDRDISDEHFNELQRLLLCIRGVIAVSPQTSAIEDLVAKARARIF
jgi:hypothetical protein